MSILLYADKKKKGVDIVGYLLNGSQLKRDKLWLSSTSTSPIVPVLGLRWLMYYDIDNSYTPGNIYVSPMNITSHSSQTFARIRLADGSYQNWNDYITDDVTQTGYVIYCIGNEPASELELASYVPPPPVQTHSSTGFTNPFSGANSDSWFIDTGTNMAQISWSWSVELYLSTGDGYPTINCPFEKRIYYSELVNDTSNQYLSYLKVGYIS